MIYFNAICFKRFMALFLFLGLSVNLSGQEKVEREYRVKEEKVPSAAISWANDSFDGKKKLKWYYEQSSGKNSYEAKFKWNGHLYSVEFDTSGIIEDIEQMIKTIEIPGRTLDAILDHFDTGYDSYRIYKIQQQFSGPEENLKRYAQGGGPDALIIRYEIEFKGKTPEGIYLWEGLFDSEGKMLRTRKIIPPPTSNIEL